MRFLRLAIAQVVTFRFRVKVEETYGENAGEWDRKVKKADTENNERKKHKAGMS